MNKQVEFLEYLRRANANIEFKDVTRKLIDLGLRNEEHISDFLESLRDRKFIEWRDARPRIPDNNPHVWSVTGISDPNSPLKYSVKLELAGVEYLDDRKIKTGANKATYISVIFTIVLGIVNIYQAFSNNEKDVEIRNLKQETKELHTDLTAKNTSIAKLDAELREVKKSSSSKQQVKDTNAISDIRRKNDAQRVKPHTLINP